MDIAYSLLAHQYVAARDADYVDARKFQIVCAACKEPVFKAVRQLAERESHYFSHYEASEETAAACEQRVERIPHGEVVRVQTESRQQAIKRFLAVFRRSIAAVTHPGQEPGFLREFAALDRKREFQDFADEAKRNLMGGADWLRSAEQGLLNWDAKRGQTGLEAKLARQLAVDLLGHLVTPAARGNFRLLVFASMEMSCRTFLEDPDAAHLKVVAERDLVDLVEGFDPVQIVWLRRNDYAAYCSLARIFGQHLPSLLSLLDLGPYLMAAADAR